MFNLETAVGNHSYDDKSNHHSRCSSLKDQTVLWIGVAIVCSASIALMVTFCPESSGSGNNQGTPVTSSLCCCCTNQRRILPDSQQNDGISEPLLPNREFVPDNNAIASGASVESQREDNSAAANNAETALNDEPEDKASSRLRGTTRLLKLAGSQTMYLWLGIVVLLIRLPFSLSIPNFVSAVIGDLIDADYDGARRNVLLLFLLGSVDSVLDFWW